MVERGGLENRCPFTGTQGSNPCLSAIFPQIENDRHRTCPCRRDRNRGQAAAGLDVDLPQHAVRNCANRQIPPLPRLIKPCLGTALLIHRLQQPLEIAGPCLGIKQRQLVSFLLELAFDPGKTLRILRERGC